MFTTCTVLIFLGSCKLDNSRNQGELVAAMSGSELLFFRENQEQIQLQENLKALARDASRYGYLNVVRYLYTLNTDLNANDDEGYNAIILAAAHGDLPLVRFLVEQTGADVRSKTRSRLTSLMLAAQGGYEDVCRYLLDRGANVNARTKHGASVLMFAATSGKQSLVKLLIDNGASLHLSDDSGATAADYATTTEVVSVFAAVGLAPSGPLAHVSPSLPAASPATVSPTATTPTAPASPTPTSIQRQQ